MKLVTPKRERHETRTPTELVVDRDAVVASNANKLSNDSIDTSCVRNVGCGVEAMANKWRVRVRGDKEECL